MTASPPTTTCGWFKLEYLHRKLHGILSLLRTYAWPTLVSKNSVYSSSNTFPNLPQTPKHPAPKTSPSSSPLIQSASLPLLATPLKCLLVIPQLNTKSMMPNARTIAKTKTGSRIQNTAKATQAIWK